MMGVSKKGGRAGCGGLLPRGRGELLCGFSKNLGSCSVAR
jgi:hypothetical protein